MLRLSFSGSFPKFSEKISENLLTNEEFCDIIFHVAGDMRWCSTMAVQLICNQQVVGSNPITSSKYMGEFPSGQRGQTVNLLAMPSVVRIHLPPPTKNALLSTDKGAYFE